jgi:transposase-like protein
MAKRVEISTEFITALVSEVEKAHNPGVVARKMGVHPSTYKSWMKRGEKCHLDDTGQKPSEGEPYLYRFLYEKIEEAESFAEMDLLNKARTAADQGRTTARQYLDVLERRFPDRWRRREPVTGETAASFDAIARAILGKQADGKPALKAVDDRSA